MIKRLQDFYEQTEDLETVTAILKLSGTNWVIDAIPQFERVVSFGSLKVIYVLGTCPYLLEKIDLDNRIHCLTERIVKALEIPGGPRVIFLDIRKECRRQVKTENGERTDAGFCYTMYEERSDEVNFLVWCPLYVANDLSQHNGIAAISFEMEIGEKEYGIEPVGIFSFATPWGVGDGIELLCALRPQLRQLPHAHEPVHIGQIGHNYRLALPAQRNLGTREFMRLSNLLHDSGVLPQPIQAIYSNFYEILNGTIIELHEDGKQHCPIITELSEGAVAYLAELQQPTKKKEAVKTKTGKKRWQSGAAKRQAQKERLQPGSVKPKKTRQSEGEMASLPIVIPGRVLDTPRERPENGDKRTQNWVFWMAVDRAASGDNIKVFCPFCNTSHTQASVQHHIQTKHNPAATASAVEKALGLKTVAKGTGGKPGSKRLAKA